MTDKFEYLKRDALEFAFNYEPTKNGVLIDYINHLVAKGHIVPNGYVMVPKEPTDEMIENAVESTIDLHPEQAELSAATTPESKETK